MFNIPPVKYFSPSLRPSQDGLIGYSPEIYPGMLLEAYTHGIFPWPMDEEHILWFSPQRRAILRFEQLILTPKVQRELQRKQFTLTINQRFEEVIVNCSRAKRKDDGTWITAKMIDAYMELHNQGYAWSFETIDNNGNLAGGLYGVLIDSFFAGESMFYHTSGASKFALIETIKWLSAERGVTWLDSQVLNPFTVQFGACEISRATYLKLLQKTLQVGSKKL